jgi:hypothetical protein
MNNIYEDLISFVWQYRKLPLHLKTTDDEAVEVIHPGQKNTDSGPDFFGAKLKIGDTLWAGNVEIHVKSSDWLKHGHQKDRAYDSVILHVVYENDVEIHTNSSAIPVIEVKNFIDQKLADTYYELLSSTTWIPCQKNLSSVEQITIKPWLSRIMAERLEHKTHSIREMLANTKMDWETTFFHYFSSCFGFKLNNDAFLMLARSISFKTLMKHQDNSIQMEALLFGQSGLLLKMHEDTYAIGLRKEYEFLRNKYNLTPIDPKIWKFMRTRPGNFPTVRISQLAQILSRMNHLLSEMFGQVQPQKIRQLLQSQTTPYWESHFNFGKKSDNPRPKHLGNLAVDNLIINAVVPFVFLYGQFHDNDKFRNAAIEMLENIAPEDNHILKKWKTLGIEADNSAESQALIELFNSYCSQKKCLSCSIGASLLLDIH